MKIKRHVSLYVEWTKEEEIGSVSRLLKKYGIEGFEADIDMDVIDFPQVTLKRHTTVFRFWLDRKIPVYELMTDLICLPEIYSVSEMTGLFK